VLLVQTYREYPACLRDERSDSIVYTPDRPSELPYTCGSVPAQVTRRSSGSSRITGYPLIP